MLERKRNFRPVLALIVLIGASLACNFPGYSGSGNNSNPVQEPNDALAEEPLPTPPQSQTETSVPEDLTVTLSEEELNTMIVRELQADDDTPVEEARLDLQAGQAVLTGRVNQGGFPLPLELVVTVEVGEQGRPAFRVLSGSVGPIPLPEATLDQIETQMNTALINNLGEEVNQVYVESVVINDTSVTISGRPR